MFALPLLILLFTAAFAKVRISEVVPHSDVEDGYYDYVELWNTGEKPADLTNWFLSDKGSDLKRCPIKAGTILQPNEHRSFSCQAPNQGHPPMTGYCQFRLSKINDHVYLGRVVNGKYEMMDDANIGATINRISNTLWSTSDDKDTYMMAFPTENFAERYPIVGPFVISEIVWAPPAGQQQYIKIQCIFGKQTYTGGASLTTHWGQRFQIRFEQHKDLYNNDVLTPAAFDLPTSITLNKDQFMYVTSGDPNTFRAQKGLAGSVPVVGPWRGNLLNATSGNIWLGFYGQEHSGMYIVEIIRWKAKGKDGWRPMKNGGIQRVSMNSVGIEPDNWIGIGDQLTCNLTSAYPASDCPHMDDCTANYCENVGGKGVCKYDALVCNHPNWERCYPDYICKLPAPSRYNAGCKLSSAPFGHTTSDTEAWGFYTNVPGWGGTVGNEILWYDYGCTKRALDCDVGGWKSWTKCQNCQDNQNRSRPVQQAASVNPAGKACPEIFQKRACNHDGKCKPCDYLKCTKPKICWANNKTFTATCELPVPCELSEWKDAYCDRSCGGGMAYRYRNITKPAQFGGACDPNQLVAMKCNEFPCPVNCQWSAWTDYGTCSSTCGGGSQVRSRRVVVQASNGGLECTGSSAETRTCNTAPCPIHCKGQFDEWSDCSCLTQSMSRTYSINEHEQDGGTKCPFTDGHMENKTCSVPPCVPIDCGGWWEEWTNCSFASKSQTQSFHVETQPQWGGKECPAMKTQKCTPVTEEQETAPSSGLPGWAIALIVIGAVVGAAILAGALIAAWTAGASGAVPEGAYQQY